MILQTPTKTMPDVSRSLEVSTSGRVHCADGGWERTPSDVSQHVTNNHTQLAWLNHLRLSQTCCVASFGALACGCLSQIEDGSQVAFSKSHDIFCMICNHWSESISLQTVFIADFGCYHMRLRLYSSSLTPC